MTPELPFLLPKTVLVTGDAVEAVREMKREDDKPMRTLGSITFCRSPLKAGLVDRFRVVTFPVITGQDRIDDRYPNAGLDMAARRTFDGRLQLLEYVSRVLASPLGTPDGQEQQCAAEWRGS